MSTTYIKQNTDITINGTLVDSDGAAIDITGAVITFAMRPKNSGFTPALFTGSVTVGASGTFTIPITDTESAALTQGVNEVEVGFVIGGSKTKTLTAEITVVDSLDDT